MLPEDIQRDSCGTGSFHWSDLTHHNQGWGILLHQVWATLRGLDPVHPSWQEAVVVSYVCWQEGILMHVKFLLPSRFPSRLLVSALLLLDIPTSFCVMHSFPSHDLNHRSLVLGISFQPDWLAQWLYQPLGNQRDCGGRSNYQSHDQIHHNRDRGS